MTFTEKFEELKEKYASKADFSKINYDFAAQISLTDFDCENTFYVARINNKTDVQPYNYYDNTVSIKIDSSLLEELLEGKKNPVNEFLLGNIDAEGDASHALALIDALKTKKRTRKKSEIVIK
ncbi:MAG: SCP2 sterol-binding domain-containing protein [Oscillospiraceae bacterium]|nr:SCP2 sterol-binding domain-containing protein [Oscillospiraceae bacterium]